jgi:hypothetical protein
MNDTNRKLMENTLSRRSVNLQEMQKAVDERQGEEMDYRQYEKELKD